MIISLATAKLHLRVTDSDEDALITAWSSAAQEQAIAFLDRNVYDDQGALDTAKAAAPAALTAAIVTYEAALDTAMGIENERNRVLAIAAADQTYRAAKYAYLRTINGIVVNDSIRAAILLTIGHLYENRQDVVTGISVAEMPNGVKSILHPFKSCAVQ